MKDSKKKTNAVTPTCFNASSNPYPLCNGGSTPQEIAENDCNSCCLYENYEQEE